MIYQNLQSELTTVAEQMTDEEKDRRFNNWAKFIDSVDPKGKDGYAFKGDWINDGTVEVELGKPRLALVYFRHGSMKYNYGEYAVVKITADGQLEPTGIMASDADGKGWALRIRDLVIAELVSLDDIGQVSPLDEFSADDLLAELARRGVAR